MNSDQLFRDGQGTLAKRNRRRAVVAQQKFRTNRRLWLGVTFVLFLGFGFLDVYPDVQGTNNNPSNFWALVSEYVMAMNSGRVQDGYGMRNAITFSVGIAVYTMFFLLPAAVIAWVLQGLIVVVRSWFIKLDTLPAQ